MPERQIRPRRTWLSNKVWRVAGGTEDNDLWVTQDAGTIRSVFVPTDEQRQAIADGANIELVIWTQLQPPVAVCLNDGWPIGKRPDVPELCGTCDAGDCDEEGAGWALTVEDGWLAVCEQHLEGAREQGLVVEREPE